MKKIFTLSAMLVLFLSAAGAQVKTGGVAAKAPAGDALTLLTKKGMAKAPQKKIAMETGERIAGYYDTDYLPELLGDGYGGMGYIYVNGEVKAADVFEPDMISKFVGGEITKIRFALADSATTVTNAFVMELDSYNDLSGYNTDNVKAEVSLSDSTLSIGWNDVTLTTPVTIQTGKYYVIGFQYTQTSSNYPLVSDEDFDDGFYSSTYGFLLYMNADYGLDWYSFDQGHLCIQAVVKGGDFPDYDISLNNLTMDKYALAGSDLSYSYDIRNYGEKMPTSYTIKVEVDGEVVDTQSSPVALASSYQTVSGTYAVPENMEITADGHTLKVYVDQINGETPTSGTSDDELEGTFVVYNTSVDRQMHLIEEFTSVQCGYCPLGHETLAKVQENNPGKYALVAHHALGMGDDPYAVSEDLGMQYVYSTMDYIEYFLLITAYPMASFDRAILNDDNIPGSTSISFEVGYSADYQESAAELFDQAVDNYYATVPAFLPVDISASYNESSRVLNVKVSGTGVDIAKDLLGDDVLNVFLLEDSLINYQENYSGTSSYSYVHNNVLRRTLSYCYGDDIDWFDNSSSSYENNYVVTLDSSWKPWNMKVVAFISGPMLRFVGTAAYWTTQETGYVNNCNMLELSEITGISSVVAETNAAETARYAVDGTRLAAPAKGVNIVKMSDGSVKKVVVK